jgi:hypothetical protein
MFTKQEMPFGLCQARQLPLKDLTTRLNAHVAESPYALKVLHIIGNEKCIRSAHTSSNQNIADDSLKVMRMQSGRFAGPLRFETSKKRIENAAGEEPTFSCRNE